MDFIDQLTPKLASSLEGKGYDFVLIAIPKYQLGQRRARYITNFTMQNLIAFLREQAQSLEKTNAPVAGSA